MKKKTVTITFEGLSLTIVGGHSPAEIVKKHYADAKPIKVGKLYEIWSNGLYLGKSKSKKGAWKSALRNL